MSWNEQGGDKDPWGGRRGDQAPPDIDEALKRLKEKVTAFTGEKGFWERIRIRIWRRNREREELTADILYRFTRSLWFGWCVSS